jgi:antitoxin component of MazEF toxin-antitoxin module
MLTRKVRKVGSSLVITIPSQIAEVYGIDEGMDISITPQGPGRLQLQWVKKIG